MNYNVLHFCNFCKGHFRVYLMCLSVFVEVLIIGIDDNDFCFIRFHLFERTIIKIPNHWRIILLYVLPSFVTIRRIGIRNKKYDHFRCICEDIIMIQNNDSIGELGAYGPIMKVHSFTQWILNIIQVVLTECSTNFW